MRKMIQANTSMCPRNTTNTTLNTRYQLNDQIIRYQHLKTVMFSDTMYDLDIAGKLVRKCIFSQTVPTNFGYIFMSTLQYKRYNHLSFKQLIKEVGVSNNMVIDEANPNMKGETTPVFDQA